MVTLNNSILSNWRTRRSPRVSTPAAPASRRNAAAYATYLAGSMAASSVSSAWYSDKATSAVGLSHNRRSSTAYESPANLGNFAALVIAVSVTRAGRYSSR